MGRRKNKHLKTEQQLLEDLIVQIEQLKRYMNLVDWEGQYELGELSNSSANAEITANCTYLKFNMTLSRESVLSWLDQEDWPALTDIVLHELSHLIIDPMYFESIKGVTCEHVLFPYLREKRENAVERVRRLVQQTLPDDLYIRLNLAEYSL